MLSKEEIVGVVCDVFETVPEEVLSKSRATPAVWARQAAQWAFMQFRTESVASGARAWNIDRETLRYNVNVVEEWIAYNQDSQFAYNMSVINILLKEKRHEQVSMLRVAAQRDGSS